MLIECNEERCRPSTLTLTVTLTVTLIVPNRDPHLYLTLTLTLTLTLIPILTLILTLIGGKLPSPSAPRQEPNPHLEPSLTLLHLNP